VQKLPKIFLGNLVFFIGLTFFGLPVHATTLYSQTDTSGNDINPCVSYCHTPGSFTSFTAQNSGAMLPQLRLKLKFSENYSGYMGIPLSASTSTFPIAFEIYNLSGCDMVRITSPYLPAAWLNDGLYHYIDFGTSAGIYNPLADHCNMTSGINYNFGIYNMDTRVDVASAADANGKPYQINSDSEDLPSLSVVDVYRDITTNTTWDFDKTYIVAGNLKVNSGVTLTVQPGAVIKFSTATSSGLTVNGTLDVPDTTASTTIFTSLKDDLAEGDTNGDGASTTPASGDWDGVTINPGGIVEINNAIIRYGSSANGSGGMVYNNGGQLNIANSTIVSGSGYGIKNSAGTSTITTSDIAYNTHGIYVSGGSVSVEATSTIHDNSSYGIYNSTTSYINAEGNYWGDSSGPYHASNSTGAGNAVSDYVDFLNWIGTSTLHYIHTDPPPSVSTCLLRYATATTYTNQLDDAVATWNSLGRVGVGTATSTIDLNINNVNLSDVPFKGIWNYTTTPDSINLNAYFLDYNTYAQVQNTITHELGHALGLEHSYTGNVLFLAQSSQTALGPQDVSDYNYLWTSINACP
jgi:hypothetical protein